ncbi:hypothetical protein VCHENC02_5334A, partial [Vibrio harveyi]
MFCSSSAHIT